MLSPLTYRFHIQFMFWFDINFYSGYLNTGALVVGEVERKRKTKENNSAKR